MNEQLISYIKDLASKEKSLEALNSIEEEILLAQKDKHTYLVLSAIETISEIIDSRKNYKNSIFVNLEAVFTSTYVTTYGASAVIYYFDKLKDIEINPTNNTSLYEINTLLTNTQLCDPRFTGLLKDKKYSPVSINLAKEPEKLLELYLPKDIITQINCISLEDKLSNSHKSDSVKFKV